MVIVIAFALLCRDWSMQGAERAVNVDIPLTEVLESEQWVDEHSMDSRRGELVIRSGWSERMPARLKNLLERVSGIAGDRYRLIRILDSRTPELEELFYRTHLASIGSRPATLSMLHGTDTPLDERT